MKLIILLILTSLICPDLNSQPGDFSPKDLIFDYSKITSDFEDFKDNYSIVLITDSIEILPDLDYKFNRKMGLHFPCLYWNEDLENDDLKVLYNFQITDKMSLDVMNIYIYGAVTSIFTQFPGDLIIVLDDFNAGNFLIHFVKKGQEIDMKIPRKYILEVEKENSKVLGADAIDSKLTIKNIKGLTVKCKRINSLIKNLNQK